MITINADRLQDGLYNIKNGQIFKYKANGGTVRTYEMGEIVRCKDCRYFKKIVERSDSGLCYRDLVASARKGNGYCSRGERKGGDTE